MIFFDLRVSVDLSSWGGVDSNPSVSDLVLLHVSVCGASTLLPDGDPPMFFFHKSVTASDMLLTCCVVKYTIHTLFAIIHTTETRHDLCVADLATGDVVDN